MEQWGNRRKLPVRRYTETRKVTFLGISYFMTVGFYEDGVPGEVFLNVDKKMGSMADCFARDTAIGISFALQYGTPVDHLAEAMTLDEKGEPLGLAGCVLQELCKWGRE